MLLKNLANNFELKNKVADIIKDEAGCHDCTQVSHKILEEVDNFLASSVPADIQDKTEAFKEHLLAELQRLPGTERSRQEREDGLIDSLTHLLNSFYELGKATTP